MSIQIDRKSLAIAALSFTAALLIAANFCWTPRAQAETVKGDQYIAVTGRIAQGGDGLYLTNRDGVMAVFVYNPNKKEVEPRAIKSIVDAFNGAPAAMGPNKRKY
jgi:hypothetical protein